MNLKPSLKFGGKAVVLVLTIQMSVLLLCIAKKGIVLVSILFMRANLVDMSIMLWLKLEGKCILFYFALI